MEQLLRSTVWTALAALVVPLGAAAQQAKAASADPRREVYKTVGDVQLSIELVVPEDHDADDRRPALVFFFGGGWNSGTTEQFRPQADYLASRGMVAALADYRVRSRHKTSPFACVADGKSAVRWLRTHAARLGIDPKRIGAGGGSAGGHVAAAAGVIDGLDEAGEEAAVSSRPDALVLFNPVFDNGPGGWGHARVQARWQEISPLHNIQKGAPPTTVFLGSQDKLIPVATARRYEQRMQAVGARCDVHIYEGQGHGFFNRNRSPDSFARTVREMDRFLASLGWLEGAPTLPLPDAPSQPKKSEGR